MTTFDSAPSANLIRPPISWGARAGALVALTKPRLTVMSVLTGMTTYFTAGGLTNGLFLATLLGTSLSACGALSLNQWWERRTDALMQRTWQRPLPQALLTPAEALSWSLSLSFIGVGLLATCVNGASALLAVATILIYGVVYTPLKRRTRWATEVGSISGALPALLGSAAAGDIGSRPGLALFGILLCWQMPHFFAIGWRHRFDYQLAGFPLRPAGDPTGSRTAAWAFGYTTVLLGVSIAPWALGWLGAFYGMMAIVGGGWFLLIAWRFARTENRDAAAKRFFLASIAYLPAIMIALIIDRLMS
ncbi:MAG TPA: heme o synthase [Opitutus sp.]|nr:heme o synthase [Opitutus sp.]